MGCRDSLVLAVDSSYQQVVFRLPIAPPANDRRMDASEGRSVRAISCWRVRAQQDLGSFARFRGARLTVGVRSVPTARRSASIDASRAARNVGFVRAILRQRVGAKRELGSFARFRVARPSVVLRKVPIIPTSASINAPSAAPKVGFVWKKARAGAFGRKHMTRCAPVRATTAPGNSGILASGAS
jgi:hypothetical protein